MTGDQDVDTESDRKIICLNLSDLVKGNCFSWTHNLEFEWVDFINLSHGIPDTRLLTLIFTQCIYTGDERMCAKLKLTTP